MTATQQLSIWLEASDHLASGNLDRALQLFQSLDASSKIAFNISVIHFQKEEYPSAIQALSDALHADPYLAIAHFQRAFARYMMGDHRLAEADYSKSLELLGENEEMDYHPIGLDFKLYKCEILFNRAMCYSEMGKDQQCILDIFLAKKCAVTPIHERIIVKAGRQGLDAINLFTLASGTIFKVSESKSRNLTKRIHLKGSQILKVDGQEIKSESSRLPSTLSISATLDRPRVSSMLSRRSSSKTLPRTVKCPSRKSSLTYRSRSHSNPEIRNRRASKEVDPMLSSADAGASNVYRSPLSSGPTTPNTPPLESISLSPVQDYVRVKIKSPEHVIALNVYAHMSFQEVKQKIKNKLHLAILPDLYHQSSMIVGHEEFSRLLKTPTLGVLTLTIEDDIFDFY